MKCSVDFNILKINVAEIRPQRWMCGHTMRDEIRNEDIQNKVGVASIKEKMRETRLTWFGMYKGDARMLQYEGLRG